MSTHFSCKGSWKWNKYSNDLIKYHKFLWKKNQKQKPKKTENQVGRVKLRPSSFFHCLYWLYLWGWFLNFHTFCIIYEVWNRKNFGKKHLSNDLIFFSDHQKRLEII